MEEITTEGVPKRPQFLTVLCILTYIGVGLGIIGSIFGWWSMNKMSQLMDTNSGMEDMGSMPGMEEAMDKIGPALKWANELLITGILGCILCLVGALQMWKLKRIGFYIYVVGEVVPVIISGILMGASAFGGMQIFGLVIPVIFLVLYGINFKHLS